jgi:hypothetical protein
MLGSSKTLTGYLGTEPIIEQKYGKFLWEYHFNVFLRCFCAVNENNMLEEAGLLEDTSMLGENSMLEDSSIMDSSAMEDSGMINSSINNSTLNTGDEVSENFHHSV